MVREGEEGGEGCDKKNAKLGISATAEAHLRERHLHADIMSALSRAAKKMVNPAESSRTAEYRMNNADHAISPNDAAPFSVREINNNVSTNAVISSGSSGRGYSCDHDSTAGSVTTVEPQSTAVSRNTALDASLLEVKLAENIRRYCQRFPFQPSPSSSSIATAAKMSSSCPPLILPSLSTVPRQRMFYKTSYQKAAGLGSDHPFMQVTNFRNLYLSRSSPFSSMTFIL